MTAPSASTGSPPSTDPGGRELPAGRVALRTVAGLAVSAVFLWLAARQLQWSQFHAALREVSIGSLFLAATLTTTSYALRGERWRMLFPASEAPSYLHCLKVLLIGYAVSNIVPARAGDLARAHLLGRDLGVSRARVLATVLLERAFDVLSLVVLFALALPLLGKRLEHGREMAVLAVVLLVLMGLGGLVFFFRPPDASRRTRWSQFVEGLHALGSLSLSARLAGFSLLIWLIDCAAVWAVMSGFSAPSSWGAALSASVFGNLATVIPAGPAAVGTFEFAVKEVLRPWGIAPATALAMAVVYHLVQFLLVTTAGAISWVSWNARDLPRPAPGAR